LTIKKFWFMFVTERSFATEKRIKVEL
jgi:hypothetical protein